MKIIQTRELEGLVRQTFPQKGFFSARAELDGSIQWPFVIFVHGGADPYLDQHFDAWVGGSPRFVSAYQVMNAFVGRARLRRVSTGCCGRPSLGSGPFDRAMS